ncbi:MAG: NusG domain II-containing protein [Anaerosomatales bacterium]|nr:NusG domain II-containing protein [Anaerosomatales bacterium]MDT8433560.1 NusG domain II-containing protein [Anaerosomatales bacterium]
MTRGDVLVAIAVVAVALLTVPSAVAMLAPAGDAAVLRGPAGSTTVSTTSPGTYVVEGHAGRVVFRVVGGQVMATAADCPDRLCVRMGAAAPGRPVVCAPNGVSATLERGEELDAVSR